jgi:prepilin-type N-terminal cleavage/methylation domain-containing protein/prepilin-type processing-associated H-X9-DG protein
MKKLSAARERKGFTLLEVLVVAVVCVVVIAMILPSIRPAKYPDGPACMSQLRQIDISLQLYAQDYKGKLPMPSSLPDANLVEIAYANGPLPQYRLLSLYLRDPDLLVCPAETHRSGATNFNYLTQSNISYFLNADASLTNFPNASILGGDRNLQANGQPVSPGLFVLTTNLDVNWTRELHRIGGNVAFADGHVQFCRRSDLNALIQHQSIPANRLLVP